MLYEVITPDREKSHFKTDDEGVQADDDKKDSYRYSRKVRKRFFNDEILEKEDNDQNRDDVADDAEELKSQHFDMLSDGCRFMNGFGNTFGDDRNFPDMSGRVDDQTENLDKNHRITSYNVCYTKLLRRQCFPPDPRSS